MKIKILRLYALSCLFLLFLGTLHLYAIPARPGLIEITQSDGTTIKIRIYGDEFYHYALSEDGYTLVPGPNQNYYYATLAPDGQLTSTGVMARPMNSLSATERRQLGRGFTKGVLPLSSTIHKQKMRRVLRNTTNSTITRSINGFTPPGRLGDSEFSSTGHSKGLVLLAEFPDLPFTTGRKEHFEELLNSRNYIENGSTGSAWQYYYDNSNGHFDPEFIVVGPYTLPHERSYYTDNDDELAYEMVVDVCRMAAANGIDFTPYSEAGIMRDVFVFYSGGNEADGSDPDGIWPHRYSVAYQGNYVIGGVQLAGYACGSELSKYEDGSNKFAAIGTFCHEFGHVLGWPDFYDTDYSTNGLAAGPGYYSLMANGCYNNDSRTPPALSILERWMVGWTEPEVLSTSGEFHLESICRDKGYLIGTDTKDDYFLLEYRGSGETVWDAPEFYWNYESPGASGLLVYHIDYTIPSKWVSYNTVNSVAGHECMKLVCSSPDVSNAAYYSRYSFFPGGRNVTSLISPKHHDFRSWKGGNALLSIADISIKNGYLLLTTDDTVYGMSDYEIEAYQRDALLSWKDNIGTSWIVTWKLVGDNTYLGRETLRQPKLHLGALRPGKQYEVVIQNSDNIEHTFSFSTARKNPYLIHIGISPETPTSNSQTLFYLLDANSDDSNVVWRVDGQTSPAYTTLSVGEHRIQAEITHLDGDKEYLMQYITIR